MSFTLTRRSLLASAAAFAVLPAFAKTSDTKALDATLTKLLRRMPESCVYAGLTAAQVGTSVLDRLDDYSVAGEAANRAGLRAALAETKALPRPSNAARVAAAVYQNALRVADVPYGRLTPLSFTGHTPFIVNQIGGGAIDPLNGMAAQQPVSTVAEADAYIAKLKDFPRAIDGMIAKVKADAALGCVLPQALMTKTLAYLAEFVATPAKNNELTTTMLTKMGAAKLDGTSHALAAEQAVQSGLYPAMAKLRDALAALAPKARASDGIWAQPQGEHFYGGMVQALGDSKRTPAQIHALGLSEVARITAEMDAGLRKLGLAGGAVGARMKALAAQPENMYADSDAGRAQLLDDLRAQVAAVNAKMPQFLNASTIPAQQVEVRRVPVATEATAPGGYYDSPSLDGSRPGIYWINLRDMKAVSKVRLPTLTFHEAVPGHHLANAVALSTPDQPLIQKLASFNAFNEGWALYSEQLAKELGFYEDNPAGNLGRLQDELFRAVRLVVDTGLHFKRWSRTRAIAYAMDATGNVRSRMEAEIERYMAWPGQALGYKLGMIELLDMRAGLKRRLGTGYALKDFHDAVLLGGSRPLSLVAADVAKIAGVAR